MTLYTNDVRNYIHTRDWPKGLQFEVREWDMPEPHLNIVFFVDNWNLLAPDQAVKVKSTVEEVMAKLWADGIPTYLGKESHG